MILQFSVSNYKAFRERQTLNFAASNADNTLEENLLSPELPGLKKQKWLKGIGIYGANASGKSTVIEALRALASIVENSAKVTDPKRPIKEIEPFALDPKAKDEPTAFSVTFVSDSIRYQYRVAATKSQIWHESLRSFPKGVERLWYVRDWSDEGHTFSPDSPSGMPRYKDIESRTLPNTLYLSKAIAENRTELEPVFRWFVGHLKFLNLSGSSDLNREFTMHSLHKKENVERAKSIVNLLKHADIGISGARIAEEEIDSAKIEIAREFLSAERIKDLIDSKNTIPELLHRSATSEANALPWDDESTGTQRLFDLSGPWLDILENGYTVFVDELETSLHPHIVRELLRIFFSKEHNKNNAQLIFTTHNPLLLDTNCLMRRDQVWFTDKDKNGESHLYPLTDYKPRKGESLVRGYMAGRYGGVPFIPNGLLGTEPQNKKEISCEL